MKHLILLFVNLICLTMIGQESSTFPGIPTTEFQRVDVYENNVIALGSCDHL